MKSKATPRFWKLYQELPRKIQILSNKAYEIWSRDTFHPSLHFKKIKGGLFSVRIGDHYRALGYFDGEQVIWTWIGSHEQYNKLIRQH